MDQALINKKKLIVKQTITSGPVHNHQLQATIHLNKIRDSRITLPMVKLISNPALAEPWISTNISKQIHQSKISTEHLVYLKSRIKVREFCVKMILQ